MPWLGVVWLVSRAKSCLHWLARAGSDASLSKVQNQLRNLLNLHYRYRFDPEGLSEVERAALRQEAKLCLNAVAGSR